MLSGDVAGVDRSTDRATSWGAREMATDLKWWRGDVRERFWLEATDREDLGANLKAPIANIGGEEEWRYGLFRDAEPGDLVFHYDKRRGAITAVSTISGPERLGEVIWAARGTYARERGARPEPLPGYYRDLVDHRPLATPLTLEAMRADQARMATVVGDLGERYRSALYFPFEVGDRPTQLNQGYAFKLPADFVAAFSQLATAAGAALEPTRDRAPLSVPSGAVPLVRRVVEAIEVNTEGYRIGGLQEIRKALRGLKRRPGSTLFSDRSTTDTWAFHSGGRDELQFNVGLDEFADGSASLRAGVAFSLEPSRSLPDWTVLLPLVARFNDFLRAEPQAFGDLAMWCWSGEARGPDRPPGPIGPEELNSGDFIFLGARQPVGAVDVHHCLRTFDRLLPLYRHVLSREAATSHVVAAPPSSDVRDDLRLDRGVDVRSEGWRRATIAAQVLDIPLRHHEMQNRLRRQLEAEGVAFVTLEARLGLRAIDAVTRCDEGLCFYEVKTCASVRQCLREALGQLLEYALWPGSTRPARMVVVGPYAPTADALAYLEALNASFPVPVAYRQVALD